MGSFILNKMYQKLDIPGNVKDMLDSATLIEGDTNKLTGYVEQQVAWEASGNWEHGVFILNSVNGVLCGRPIQYTHCTGKVVHA